MANKLELNGLNDEQLKEELHNAEKHYSSMRYTHYTTPLQNNNELKHARRNVARIKTEMRARELAQEEEKGDVQRDRIRARRRQAKKKN